MDVQVHLLSLATGAHHPAAPEGAILAHKSAPSGRARYALRTSGDLLGMVIQSAMDDTKVEFLVWNWKTGSLQLVSIRAAQTHAPVD